MSIIIGLVTSGALFSHGIYAELSRNCLWVGRVIVERINILSCNKRKVIITLNIIPIVVAEICTRDRCLILKLFKIFAMKH